MWFHTLQHTAKKLSGAHVATSPLTSCEGKWCPVGLVSSYDTTLTSLQGLHLPSLTSYSQYPTLHLILSTPQFLNSPQAIISCGRFKHSHIIKTCQENVSNFETKTETGLNHSFKYHKIGMSKVIMFFLSSSLGPSMSLSTFSTEGLCDGCKVSSQIIWKFNSIVMTLRGGTFKGSLGNRTHGINSRVGSK
jgi:hypothetical protein